MATSTKTTKRTKVTPVINDSKADAEAVLSAIGADA